MFPALPRRPKSLKTLGTRLLVVRNSWNGTFSLSTPMSTHDELGSRLGRTIDLPHDTCHLSKRFRIDGIKAMSRGIRRQTSQPLPQGLLAFQYGGGRREDCWEKCIRSSLPARLMEEFSANEVHLQPTTWLSGKFPSRRICPNITRQNGCGLKGKFRPLVEGGGWVAAT